MVITYWSAWYLGQYWLLWDVTGTDQKVFLRAFCSHWDHENYQRIDGDMAKWSLWQWVWNSGSQVGIWNIKFQFCWLLAGMYYCKSKKMALIDMSVILSNWLVYPGWGWWCLQSLRQKEVSKIDQYVVSLLFLQIPISWSFGSQRTVEKTSHMLVWLGIKCIPLQTNEWI